MNTNWYYEINTLKTEELFDNTTSITENKQLINKNYEAGKNIVKVYKKVRIPEHIYPEQNLYYPSGQLQQVPIVNYLY